LWHCDLAGIIRRLHLSESVSLNPARCSVMRQVVASSDDPSCGLPPFLTEP
jgi:hypothetical protein